MQLSLRDAVAKVCARFGDEYWLKHDRDGEFPEEFRRAIADAGWLGICMPETYGGAGLGITEAAIMMQAIAESGAGLSGASAVHMNIFGLNPVVVFGTDAQKAPHAAAADRRQGEGVLRGDRARRRPRHHEAQRRAPSAAATVTF